jgi:PAS domain S-box-containing protein
MLRKQPYDVFTANHAYQAIEIVSVQPVDIMITDIRMPDMNGMKLLRAVRDLNPDVMVIAISAQGDLETAVEFMKEGGVDFLQKPISNDALRLAIRSAAEKWKLRHDLRLANEALQHAHNRLNENQQRLRESEAKYRLMAENAADVIWTIDENLDLTYASPALAAILGFTPEEAIGRSILTVVPESARARARDILKRHIFLLRREKRRQPQRYELELVAKSGQLIWIETVVDGHCTEDGRIVGLQGMLRNITEQKKAELQVRAHLQFMETLINTIPNPVYYKDANGVIRGCNYRYAHEVLQRPRREIIGRTLPEIECALPLELREKLQAEDCYLTNRPGVFSNEFQLSVNDIEKYFLSYRATYSDAQGNVAGLVGILLDITDRKLIENDLKVAKDAAEAAAKVKSEFLANMSHEIRTPLNAVIGLTTLLNQTKLNSEQKDYVETIAGSGEALLSIIDHILNMSKIESGMLELEKIPYDVRKCAESALNIVAPKAAERGIELIYDIGPDVPYSVIGDLGRLRQILVNLLNNAVKFTEEGEVVLVVTAGKRRKQECEIHFSVRDTGIGIDTVKVAQIFEPFRQADSSTTRRYGGTGLGLAICRELCEMMGGELRVQSEPGYGACFSFYITVQLSPLELRKYESYPSMAGRHVLVSIANRTLDDVITRMLCEWEMKVIECKNSLVLEKILEADTAMDVAILDNNVVTRSVKMAEVLKSYRDIPVLFLSKIGSERNVASGLVDGWLNKPVKPWMLRETLIQLVLNEKMTVAAATAHEEQTIDCPLDILVVEDNLVNQKVAQKMLKSLGFESEVAACGDDALEIIKSRQYDVIFMDIQMPGRDGLQTTVEIRRRRYPVYIVGMTAHALREDKNRCIAAGMDTYIAKPVKQQLLVEALREAQKAKLNRMQAE